MIKAIFENLLSFLHFLKIFKISIIRTMYNNHEHFQMSRFICTHLHHFRSDALLLLLRALSVKSIKFQNFELSRALQSLDKTIKMFKLCSKFSDDAKFLQ